MHTCFYILRLIGGKTKSVKKINRLMSLLPAAREEAGAPTDFD